MSNTSTNQVTEREAPASSVQSNQVKGKVKIPREIIAQNHRKAYALGYAKGYQGKTLRFIAPIVRNSLVRGWLEGERDRAALLDLETIEGIEDARARTALIAMGGF